MRLAGLHLGLLPRRMGIAVTAITLAVVASLVWVVIVGDGHAAPEIERDPLAVAWVCPSAERWRDALEVAALRMTARGVEPPAVLPSSCEAGPRPGEAQVRAAHDLVSSHPASVEPPYVDLVVRTLDGSAVAYIDVHAARRCTPAHVLGHLAGLGHSTRASSVMHPLCGSSWADVGEGR